jgi:hypothetical protein
MSIITAAEKEKFMTKSKEKLSGRRWKRRAKVLKARYDAKSHFAAFDVCPVRVDGKRAPAVRRGTLEGASWKELDTMLMRVAEAFACRELHLERVGGRKAAGTFVEIIKSKGQPHA